MIWTNGRYYPVEEFQARGCIPRMKRYDEMPYAYRRLADDIDLDFDVARIVDSWRRRVR